MKTKYAPLTILILVLSCSLSAQMINGLDTLYGHEWINPSQTYLKIPVSEDGFHKITYESLSAQGWPVNSTTANDYQVFHEGEAVFIYHSNETDTPLQTGDYLVFYGKKNKGQLDQHLFRNAEQEQLNPSYSLYSDTSSYYLTYQTGTNTNFYTTIENDLNGLPPAESFVWQTKELIHSEHFMKEYYRVSGATLYYSHFGIGEGYGSRSINDLLADGSTEQSYTLALENTFIGGPSPILETRYTAALFNHIQRLSANETELRIDTFYNWAMMNVTANLPISVLSDGELRLLWEGSGGDKDEVSVGFINVKYPASPIANNSSSYQAIVPANGERQYLEISNFGGSTAIVYDMTNGWRIPVSVSNEQLTVSLPASAEDRTIRIISGESDLISAEIEPVNLDIPNTNQADYIILTSSLLRSNGDPVQEYADYRSSIAGGNYQTAVVNVEDLYDQFSYGIPLHPLGIRNFMAWQRKVNPNFKYLFIVGKGREYIDTRTAQDIEAALGNTLFVPSFGYPASDNLLLSDIDKPTPLVSTGRLPAINSAEVAQYLNKIESLEAQINNGQSIEEKAWMKNVIHLGGGSNPSEQLTIKTNLQGIGREIEEGKFGAKITSFYKTSSDPIQTSLTDQIFGRINEGVSILTFFGHSSAGTFDFNIDNPDNYVNAPKYPLMLSLGCYSGNMYADFRSIGERFIFLEDGGAGAFGASRGLGFIHALNAFAKDFYKQMSNDYYGQPIGDGIRTSIGNFEHLTDQAYGTLMEQFSLQGDPGFKLNPSPGPDYIFASEKTRFEPSIISAQKDSFEVSLTLQNIGQATEDSIGLTIAHVLPSGISVEPLTRLRIPSPAYDTEVTFKLPTTGNKSIGLNRLLAIANTSSTDPIDEAPNPEAQLNNILVDANDEAGIPFFVIDNTALPVWPPDYGLVGDPNITLKASSADALAPERTYFIELDTTPHFDLPLANTTIVQKGGVINWTPAYNWQDSTVYYWRITPDSLDIGTPDYVWETSSFTYINGIEPGWGQGHWGQYAENELENIVVEESEQLDFVENVGDLTIRNINYTIGGLSNTRPRGFVNGNRWTDFFRWNIHPSLQIVVLDTLGNFWFNENPGEYGSVHTTRETPVACFSFPVETIEQRANILHFLTEIIPDNHTVIVYNAIRNSNQDLWINDWAADSISLNDQNIFNTLESEGATQIRSLLEGAMRPYLFSYIKGAGPIDEKLAENFDDLIVYSINLPGRWTEGSMQSHTIGPAKEWDKLFWNTPPQTINDTIQIQLYGLQEDGSATLLMDSVALSGELDLTSYSTEDYPLLKLHFEGQDRVDKSCPPLKYWHIHYQGLPDLAIDSHLDFEFLKDSLQRGEEMSLKVAVSNVTDLPIESTTALFTLQNEGQDAQEWEETIPAIAPSGHHILTTSQSSKNWVGTSQLQITINSSDSPKERLRINNQAVKNFEVLSEDIVPVIDLTFDGQQILDGDLVSAQPFIQIQIEDENQYLLLNDSSLFTIRLRDPFGNERTIALDGFEAEFYPATSFDDNKARIEWPADFTAIDGEYLLTIRGKDRIGNEPRLLQEIRFEVIKEQMLGNVLPYPNPFTTSTQFVYTLTGIDSPPQYKIQIMTVSGRIVREINQDELGPLKVGTHRTEFVWDGTDTYGDRLAIGTYLYRVLAIDNEGNTLAHYDTGTDRFFKNRLGKIVILR